MYIIIPLLIVFSSLVAIFFIIWRKRSYLNKLYNLNSGTDAEPLAFGFSWKSYGAEFFPEIKSRLEGFKFYEYRSLLLMELEKSLRKARLIFMKIDRWSDSLIKKIRRVHLNGQLNGNGTVGQQITAELRSEKPELLSSALPAAISSNFLKNEEERLIIEIAQNPKDPILYESLGDLYIEMNNYADAKESYEAAIELSPQNESLKIKLSSVLEKLSTQN